MFKYPSQVRRADLPMVSQPASSGSRPPRRDRARGCRERSSSIPAGATLVRVIARPPQQHRPASGKANSPVPERTEAAGRGIARGQVTNVALDGGHDCRTKGTMLGLALAKRGPSVWDPPRTDWSTNSPFSAWSRLRACSSAFMSGRAGARSMTETNDPHRLRATASADRRPASRPELHRARRSAARSVSSAESTAAHACFKRSLRSKCRIQ